MSDDLSRRSLIASAAALGATAVLASQASAQSALPGAPPATVSPGGKTFVLVHGANNGSYVWRYVAPRLRAMGHAVYTPTLTGLADRSHLMSKDVTLETHVMDIVNLIKWEDLKNVTLVGHSYGGWPTSVVPERIGEALGSIVFLDAFMPDDGMKGLDLNSPQSKKDVLAAIEKGEVSRPPRGGEPSPTMKPEDAAWLKSKATAQPIGVSMDPVKLTGARDRVPKRAYIRARGYPNPNFDDAYNACKAKGYSMFEVPCGHSVMVEMPDRLLEILQQVAA